MAHLDIAKTIWTERMTGNENKIKDMGQNQKQTCPETNAPFYKDIGC